MNDNGFDAALIAANISASSQNYPLGALYIVATPLGNLCDITLRALHVLSIVDVIACEDTRKTQNLIKVYGISGKKLLAAHQHNEETSAQIIVDFLRQDCRVAYVSDAGTPGMSDPGGRLVRAVHLNGLKAIPIPGASSISTLLSVAGITDSHQFIFEGFLPNKHTERQRVIQVIKEEARAVFLLEAPHRIVDLSESLAELGSRKLTIGRELTKQFEDIATLAASDLASWLMQDKNRIRGEFSLVIHPSLGVPKASESARILGILMDSVSLSLAAQLTAKITGESRKALYEVALVLAKGSADAD